jgi:hypothetical protein
MVKESLEPAGRLREAFDRGEFDLAPTWVGDVAGEC